jgi:hypothetical protein
LTNKTVSVIIKIQTNKKWQPKVKAVQKTSKKIKKGLDNSYYICYNKDVNKTKQNIKERKRA